MITTNAAMPRTNGSAELEDDEAGAPPVGDGAGPPLEQAVAADVSWDGAADGLIVASVSRL